MLSGDEDPASLPLHQHGHARLQHVSQLQHEVLPRLQAVLLQAGKLRRQVQGRPELPWLLEGLQVTKQ